ncbi:hypothetical protein DITRI_Ditri12bG0175400 [Diplodiscus trichospermus]
MSAVAPQLFPSDIAREICNSALVSAMDSAKQAQGIITGLLAAQENRQLLQKCQVLNKKTIESLSSAADNLKSINVDTMVEELYEAGYAAQSCQSIIQGTDDFSVLANENSYVIKFCEISIVAGEFYLTLSYLEKKL